MWGTVAAGVFQDRRESVIMFAKSFVAAVTVAVCQLAAQALNPELSGMAATVVKESDLARQAIAAQNKQEASMHVRAALNLAEQIQTKAGAQGQPLMVPIAAETERVSTYVPVKKGKGDAAARMKKRTSIAEVSGDYTTTSLDVSNARDKLEAARTALDNGNLSAADQDLAAVQSGVVTKSGSGDMPLARARENLSLARARVQEGNYKAAAMPLKAAARALAEYQSRTPAPNAQQAAALKAQIDAYAEHLSKNHADAYERINGWLDQVSGWYNQEMTGAR
jgi:hypothetical protein